MIIKLRVEFWDRSDVDDNLTMICGAERFSEDMRFQDLSRHLIGILEQLVRHVVGPMEIGDDVWKRFKDLR